MSEKLARRFHEIYEQLAPLYGYKTREDTREFDSQSNNGRLMIAVTSEIEREFEYKNDRLKDLVQWLETIESDLREYLEVRAVKHTWQTGRPDDDREVLICIQAADGDCEKQKVYEIAHFDKYINEYVFFSKELLKECFDLTILGWKEIEPFDLFDLEEGE